MCYDTRGQKRPRGVRGASKDASPLQEGRTRRSSKEESLNRKASREENLCSELSKAIIPIQSDVAMFCPSELLDSRESGNDDKQATAEIHVIVKMK